MAIGIYFRACFPAAACLSGVIVLHALVHLKIICSLGIRAAACPESIRICTCNCTSPQPALSALLCKAVPEFWSPLYPASCQGSIDSERGACTALLYTKHFLALQLLSLEQTTASTLLASSCGLCTLWASFPWRRSKLHSSHLRHGICQGLSCQECYCVSQLSDSLPSGDSDYVVWPLCGMIAVCMMALSRVPLRSQVNAHDQLCLSHLTLVAAECSDLPQSV